MWDFNILAIQSASLLHSYNINTSGGCESSSKTTTNKEKLSYEEVVEETIQLRKDNNFLFKYIKELEKKIRLADITTIDELNQTVIQLKSDLNRTERSLTETTNSLNDALKSLQGARIEALQVLPLRLKLHELKQNDVLLKSKVQLQQAQHEEKVASYQQQIQKLETQLNEISVVKECNVLLQESKARIEVANQALITENARLQNEHSSLDSHFQQSVLIQKQLQQHNTQLLIENKNCEKKCQSLTKELQKLASAANTNTTSATGSNSRNSIMSSYESDASEINVTSSSINNNSTSTSGSSVNSCGVPLSYRQLIKIITQLKEDNCILKSRLQLNEDALVAASTTVNKKRIPLLCKHNSNSNKIKDYNETTNNNNTTTTPPSSKVTTDATTLSDDTGDNEECILPDLYGSSSELDMTSCTAVFNLQNFFFPEPTTANYSSNKTTNSTDINSAKSYYGSDKMTNPTIPRNNYLNISNQRSYSSIREISNSTHAQATQ